MFGMLFAFELAAFVVGGVCDGLRLWGVVVVAGTSSIGFVYWELNLLQNNKLNTKKNDLQCF